LGDKRRWKGESDVADERKEKRNWVSRSVLAVFTQIRVCGRVQSVLGGGCVVVEEASPRIGACGDKQEKKKKKGKKTVEQIILNSKIWGDKDSGQAERVRGQCPCHLASEVCSCLCCLVTCKV
jgi:hypothetical protein